MKKYLCIGLIIICFGCDKEELDVTDKVIWRPYPIAFIGDKEVHLQWFNTSIYNEFLYPYETIDPEIFEIFISDNNHTGFKKLIELRNDMKYSYNVTGQENNQPVYFYLTAFKKGFRKSISDTIMAMPNKQISPVELAVQPNHTMVSVSNAHTMDKIAYVDKKYSWPGGENCCMVVSTLIANTDGSQAELLDISAFEPDWSPSDKKIVFRTEKNEINLGNGTSAQIALYDYSTKIITKLTDNQVFNYAPVFSENGEMILYQSINSTSGINSIDFWLIDLNNLEKTQLTELNTAVITNSGKPKWIDNENYIFQAILENSKSQIYKSSIYSKEIEKIIASDWNDYCPAVSPDDNMVAFISDRSGTNQIWIYNISTGEYKQLTGYSSDIYLSESWNRIEWIDNQHITFTLNQNRFVKQRIQ